jgi:hypothetical protein
MSRPAPARYITTPQRRPAHAQHAPQPPAVPVGQELICRECQALFIYTDEWRARDRARGYNPPRYCGECYPRRQAKPRPDGRSRTQPPRLGVRELPVALTRDEINRLVYVLAEMQERGQGKETDAALKAKLMQAAKGER